MANVIGYARVSTGDQTLDLQTQALTAAGCAQVFTDTASVHSTQSRDELADALDYLNTGDTLVVWRLDRLGRNIVDLVHFVEDLAERGIQFRSLTEAIDTSSPGGRQVFDALAQMERELISERTKPGLAAAAARGREPGQPPALTVEQVAQAVDLFDSGASIASIARALGCSSDTVNRVIEDADNGPDPSPALQAAFARRRHLIQQGDDIADHDGELAARPAKGEDA